MAIKKFTEFNEETTPEGSDDFKNAVRKAVGHDLQLSKSWCECKEEGPSTWLFMDDNACECGVQKHHYHCTVCGKVKQVG